jgi:hypothetical protein
MWLRTAVKCARTHRRMPWFAAMIVIAVGATASCERSGSVTAPDEDGIEYVNALVDIMERFSLRKHEIDWPRFRADVLAKAGTARTVSQTYPAIREALTLLGDGHSFYVSRGGMTIHVPTRTCSGLPPSGPPAVPAPIGYVRVEAFQGPAPAALEFANGIRNAIARGFVGLLIIEMTVGSGGIGTQVIRSMRQFNTARMFAFVAVLVVTALTLITLSRKLEAKVSAWREQVYV